MLLARSNKRYEAGAYRCARRDTSQSQNTMLNQENEELRPFVIPQEDVEVLHASEGFCMLRNYLARDTRYVVALFEHLQPHPGWAATATEHSNPPPASAHNTTNAIPKPRKHGSCSATCCMRW